ncbi:hypothetical protein TELCIR_17445 [Teladorsagia circumcincta]|uniref:Uncharacterized protein n=1 Tax=Teladorsagia circumcincta TaxID=45464 RepID=A0A2G9TSZ1_TELCI|nr:hypothetical protein TELCIR_17445 [Teladorsagia circumcincta]
MSGEDGKVVMENGLLYGFDWVVWLTVLWYCVGGLSVAVCIKYADNIAKNFATSVAIILATIGSMACSPAAKVAIRITCFVR